MKSTNFLKKYLHRPKNGLSLVFSIWLLLDLFLTVIGSIKEALLPSVASLPQDGVPISPEFAFSWLQVWVNLVMVLLVAFGVNTLWYLQSTQHRQQKWQYTPATVFGLLIMACFTIPAAWHVFQAVWQLFRGHILISWHEFYYFMTVVAQIYLLLWGLRLLVQRHEHDWHKIRQKLARRK